MTSHSKTTTTTHNFLEVLPFHFGDETDEPPPTTSSLLLTPTPLTTTTTTTTTACVGGSVSSADATEEALIALASLPHVRVTSSTAAAFLRKVYGLVDTPETNEYIEWGASGESFLVHKPEEMASVIFPQVFKHAKLSSFIRQLNLYGFSKRPCVGGVNVMEFSAPFFRRGKPELLAGIRRRKPPRKDKASKASTASSADDATHTTGESECSDSSESNVNVRSSIRSLKRTRHELQREVDSLNASHRTLSAQVDAAVANSRALRADIQVAQHVFSALEGKVSMLARVLAEQFPDKAGHLLTPPVSPEVVHATRVCEGEGDATDTVEPPAKRARHNDSPPTSANTCGAMPHFECGVSMSAVSPVCVSSSPSLSPSPSQSAASDTLLDWMTDLLDESATEPTGNAGGQSDYMFMAGSEATIKFDPLHTADSGEESGDACVVPGASYLQPVSCESPPTTLGVSVGGGGIAGLLSECDAVMSECSGMGNGVASDDYIDSVLASLLSS